MNSDPNQSMKKSKVSIKERINEFARQLAPIGKALKKALADRKIKRINIHFIAEFNDGKRHVSNTEYWRDEAGELAVPFPATASILSPHELEQELVKIQYAAREYIEEKCPDTVWADMRDVAQAWLAQGGQIDDPEISDAAMRARMDYGYDVHLIAPLLATIFSMAGLAALLRGEQERALYCCRCGMYWSQPDILIADPGQKTRERARTGGEGKAKHLEGIKEIVAHQLASKDGGWEDEQSAIDSVAQSIYHVEGREFLRSGLDGTNLGRTIGGWVKESPKEFSIPLRGKP